MGVVKRAGLEHVRQMARVGLTALDIASFADLVSCDGQGRLVQIDSGDTNSPSGRDRPISDGDWDIR